MKIKRSDVSLELVDRLRSALSQGFTESANRGQPPRACVEGSDLLAAIAVLEAALQSHGRILLAVHPLSAALFEPATVEVTP